MRRVLPLKQIAVCEISFLGFEPEIKNYAPEDIAR